ncbi:GNAT family N-acetyltransferase [Pedobacter yonginense]|uniref:GNAT family N-acetyltransferase n=1 Tax=Pedobacter yonginense TaxID=651869 RepID=A0A317EJ42_9SPHI|nr:GNAT family N-acetyltransferase [Pedobacter yonginense]PWS26147.1 GNAT family N-acetyltransferase [Pedobacter yonginense]
MEEQIAYDTFQMEDSEPLLKMGIKLWKDYTEPELKKQLQNVFLSDNQRILLAKNPKGIAVGFSIFSIRQDYVEGAEKTPTGYLEGIYVEPEFRKKGIAKKFLQIGEEWLKVNNCTQIGSDTWLNDKESRKFHKKIGFLEEDELVHFLKKIT